MSEPFIGEIKMVGFNFAQRGWDFCNGQLLPISQNTALFSLLGTTFGGDGRTTFGLPDLRGRSAVNPGRGPGLSGYRSGERGGQEEVTLTQNEMPAHTHIATNTSDLKVGVSNQGVNTDSPAGSVFAVGEEDVFRSGAANTTMDASSIAGSVTTTNSSTGGSLPHTNLSPFLGMNHLIALVGLYPSRS
jgi:microcystin-dependent protein